MSRSPNTSREKRAARHQEEAAYRDHNAGTARFFDRTNKRRSPGEPTDGSGGFRRTTVDILVDFALVVGFICIVLAIVGFVADEIERRVR